MLPPACPPFPPCPVPAACCPYAGPTGPTGPASPPVVVPSFTANLNTNDIVISSQSTKVPYNETVQDSTASFDTQSGIYTVPVSGVYSFRWSLLISSTGAQTAAQVITTQLRKNAQALSNNVQTIQPLATGASTLFTISGTYQQYFAAGDAVSVWVQDSVANAAVIQGLPVLNVTPYVSVFSGVLLS